MNPDERNRAVPRFGDALRAARHSRSKRRRGLSALALLIAALCATIVLPPWPRLLWNASASTPLGLYRISAPRDLAIGDMVAADVPARWRQLAAARHYIPLNVPLVKRVAAEPGDTVCATGPAIAVNGHIVADRRRRDGRGRRIPWWRGCQTLRDGALFLLGDAPASFDGRYFGPVGRDSIIGSARRAFHRRDRAAASCADRSCRTQTRYRIGRLAFCPVVIGIEGESRRSSAKLLHQWQCPNGRRQTGDGWDPNKSKCLERSEKLKLRRDRVPFFRRGSTRISIDGVPHPD